MINSGGYLLDRKNAAVAVHREENLFTDQYLHDNMPRHEAMKARRASSWEITIYILGSSFPLASEQFTVESRIFFLNYSCCFFLGSGTRTSDFVCSIELVSAVGLRSSVLLF